MQTKSLCPECKKVIDATVYEENGQVLLKKTCPEHGTFSDVYWSDAALYKKFAQFQHDGTVSLRGVELKFVCSQMSTSEAVGTRFE